jgi:hypothetical protein
MTHAPILPKLCGASFLIVLALTELIAPKALSLPFALSSASSA